MNREDFPIFKHQAGLAYLDNAATMQKPQAVIDAVRDFYERQNANPLRGLYDLSVQATEKVEQAREKIAKFIGAESPKEIIFTSGATDGLNQAAMWLSDLSSDDEMLVSYGEHHSNLLPWVRMVEANRAVLRPLECEPDGTVQEADFKRRLTPNTRIVALNLVGNVMGGENRIKNLFKQAHNRGAKCVLDAAQAVAHQKVNVRELGADIMVFSGHKMGAPMGTGVVYARSDFLEKVAPVWLGGEMVESVSIELGMMRTEFAEAPRKFEAGTQNIGGIVGLLAAVDYLEGVGLEKIAKYEQELTAYMREKLEETVEVYGAGKGILAFNLPGVHPHDVAQFLNEKQIAVRAGWHCAEPLLEHLEIGPVVRASLSFYNTEEDVDRLAAALGELKEKAGV